MHRIRSLTSFGRLWLATGGCLAALTIAMAGDVPPVQTVFIIVLENHNWSSFKGSASAPFVNTVLLPTAARCEQYFNPPSLHPSEPNYLWLEAGTNFGVLNDGDPAVNHFATTNHLVSQLQRAGIPWKSYQEDIDGTYVPLTGTNRYAPKHNPMVFFDDVTGTNALRDPYGLAHIRPYAELASDLANHTVPRYCFITPNLCNDGHDSCPPLNNPVLQTDTWLASEIPKLTSSAAYQNNGAIFITWDEGIGGDGPIGLLVLSPLVRGGYFNNLHCTHSSLLRTVQDIFGVRPYLGDAANATNLFDLFTPFSLQTPSYATATGFQLTVTGVIPGKTNLLQTSTLNPPGWVSLATNVLPVNTLSNSFTAIDPPMGAVNRVYRVIQLP